MTTRKTFLSLVILSAPYTMYGADETRLVQDRHDFHDLDDEIAAIFDPLYTERHAQPAYAVIAATSIVMGGASSAGTAALLDKVLERSPVRFIDPFTATTGTNLALDLIKGLSAAVGTLITFAAGYKIYKVFSDGVTGPLVRQFDKLERKFTEFELSVKKHQSEYETLLDAQVQKKLEKVESSLTTLIRDIYKGIVTTKGEVLKNLSEIETLLEELKKEYTEPPELAEKIDALINKTKESCQKLDAIDGIGTELLTNHSKKHRGSPLSKFFRTIFQVKSKKSEFFNPKIA